MKGIIRAIPSSKTVIVALGSALRSVHSDQIRTDNSSIGSDSIQEEQIVVRPVLTERSAGGEHNSQPHREDVIAPAVSFENDVCEDATAEVEQLPSFGPQVVLENATLPDIVIKENTPVRERPKRQIKKRVILDL